MDLAPKSKQMKVLFLTAFYFLLVCSAYGIEQNAVTREFVLYPDIKLEPRTIAIIANEADPYSLEIAAYYQKNRHIPKENLIRVRFQPGRENLTPDELTFIRQQVENQVSPDIQAYALAWTLPFKVNCMSITSAFTFGFNTAYCSAQRCGLTRPSPYFNSTSRAPYRDYHIRPSMLLAGKTPEDTKHLIDKGILSDRSYPQGTGYLVSTPDKARSVRSVWFDQTTNLFKKSINLKKVEAIAIQQKDDVLFYFTGLVQVPFLESIKFLPGALADHLTSVGGILDGTGQMSILRWLEAGATASYGTVQEPCNHLSKFPFPAMAIWYYAQGETAIEAYWKSVEQPGEGLFIGDPLAAPFAPGIKMGKDGADVEIFSPSFRQVWLTKSISAVGPFQATNTFFALHPGLNKVRVNLPSENHYFRLEIPSEPLNWSNNATIR